MYFPKVSVALLAWSAIAAAGLASASDRTAPKPLPGHPGNVFLAGEDVTLDLPAAVGGAWRAVDYDGKTVAEGRGAGAIRLGRLPVGYYEVRRAGDDAAKPAATTIAVLAPLRAPTPESSPIDCDVAMRGLPESGMPAMANLCALAGVNWARERFAWAALEKTRGHFEQECPDDVPNDVLSAAGLKVLQVNHSSPLWAMAHGRFPADLRDAYRFYREAARRWQGKVPAIEPWNEADAWDFGNHTGSEIASMQKASYLGLKAGNPDLIACQNAFCSNRAPGTIEDFRANRAWPYFDTFNHHNYEPFFHYAAHYAAFRTISAGRPMWLTECGSPVPWSGDQTAREPNGPDLRRQVAIVVKTYAHSIHEGSAATFYFILRNYAEEKNQFGLLHNDLTPRPGYMALAAVGRLLADARPLGRIKTANPNLYAYVFRAKPDGKPRDVLAAWIDDKPEFPSAAAAPTDKPEKLNLPVAPLEVYDGIGRTTPNKGSTIDVSPAPVLAVLPDDAVAKLDMAPPPTPAPWLEGKPSPVVLQAVMRKSRVDLGPSAYRVTRGEFDRIPIYVYNFGSEKAEGRLVLKGPKDWKLALLETVQAAPGDRVGLGLTLHVPDSAAAIETITIEGDFQAAGKSVLSFRLLPEPR